jgi:hypothetical protein
MVKKRVAWFKEYREILISDIVHVQRPTAQGIDAFVHVNAKAVGATKALAMVFNPTTERITTVVVLPLYYSGLEDTVRVTVEGVPRNRTMELQRDYSLEVEVAIEAKSTAWVAVCAASG